MNIDEFTKSHAEDIKYGSVDRRLMIKGVFARHTADCWDIEADIFTSILDKEAPLGRVWGVFNWRDFEPQKIETRVPVTGLRVFVSDSAMMEYMQERLKYWVLRSDELRWDSDINFRRVRERRSQGLVAENIHVIQCLNSMQQGVISEFDKAKDTFTKSLLEAMHARLVKLRRETVKQLCKAKAAFV